MRARPPLCLSLLSVCSLLALPGCRTGAFPHYPASYREYAYIANSGGNTISVLDLVDIRPQATLQVAPHPVALAVDPSHNTVYALSQGYPGGRGTVSVIDARQNRITAAAPVGSLPSALALSPPANPSVRPSGTRLYVTNSGSNNLSVLDPTALAAGRPAVLATVGVGEAPSALAVSPDNASLVVANRQSGSVSVLGLSPHAAPRLRAVFPGCPGASSVVILPDSSKAFIACAAGHQVLSLALADPKNNTPDHLLALLDVGNNPVKLVLKPDGGEVFVLNQSANTVSEIATGTNEVGGAYLIGVQPADGVASADNSLLWVANSGADTIAVYSIDDGKLIHTVHVGSGPGPLAFSADGHLLLAADTRSGDVSLIRTFDRNLQKEPVYGALFTILPAGSHPTDIAVKAFRVQP